MARGTTASTAGDFVNKSRDVRSTPVEGKNVVSGSGGQMPMDSQVHGQAMPVMGTLKGPDKGKGGGSL